MKRIEHRSELFEIHERPITLHGTPALSIRIVHASSRRVKTGTTTAQPETLIQSLLFDLCSDLEDVAAGNMPPQAGSFDR